MSGARQPMRQTTPHQSRSGEGIGARKHRRKKKKKKKTESSTHRGPNGGGSVGPECEVPLTDCPFSLSLSPSLSLGSFTLVIYLLPTTLASR